MSESQLDEILHELAEIRRAQDDILRRQSALVKVIGAETLREGERSLMSWRQEHERLINSGRSILVAIRIAVIGAAFLVVVKTSGLGPAILKLLGVAK